MRYLCLSTTNEQTWATMSEAEADAFMGEYFAFTERIKTSGHYARRRSAPAHVQTATTVRVRNGKISTTDGPFAETKEQLGGFYMIEAKDLNEAIQIAAKHPVGAHRAASRCGRSMDFIEHAASGGLTIAVSEDGRARRAGRGRAVYRAESRRVLATLIRLLGDFDLAEEALHDAFAAALRAVAARGVPDNPRAWLVSAGRFKAIDAAAPPRAVRRVPVVDRGRGSSSGTRRSRTLDDDGARGRPAAAHLHLLPPGARARRADRAHAARGVRPDDRGDRARVPRPRRRRSRSGSCARRRRSATRASRTQVPARAELPERLDAVLHVVYLVFNEGYSATSGDALTRTDLSREAIRLGRLLVELLPEPEGDGLLALMLLHESRRAGAHDARRRAGAARRPGPLALGPRADRGGRARWSSGRCASRRFGPYTLQAAIAAVHAEAPSAAATDWRADRGAVRRAAARRAVAGRRAEPRRRGGDARRRRRRASR